MPTPSGLAPAITATGITAGTFEQWLAYFVAQMQAIYGPDIYLGNDSQDYQFIAVIAQALADCGAGAIQVYQSFSPNFAQGVGLDANVAINGLTRLVPTFSTVQVTLTGAAGTLINNGLVVDANNNTWALPPSVQIGGGGTVTVLATCQTPGAVTVTNNSVTNIATPVANWQSVTNGTNAAVVGAPTETDAALRVRQSVSTSLPSQTIFEGIVAAIENTPGVTRVKGYENNTGSTDGNGIPANTLYFLVEGGAEAAIFNAIFLKITPGIPTKGSITEVVTDSNGSTRTLKYDLPTDATINAVFSITPGIGWNATTTEPLITAAYQAYINSQPIGENVSYIGVAIACSLIGTPAAGTFTISSASTLQKNSGGAASSDVTINYNEAPVAGTVGYTIL